VRLETLKFRAETKEEHKTYDTTAVTPKVIFALQCERERNEYETAVNLSRGNKLVSC